MPGERKLLRDAFKCGALDVSHSFAMVEDFVKIFAGEQIAFSAIEQCAFLTDTQQRKLRRIAALETQQK